MIANTIIASAIRKLLVVDSSYAPSTEQYADGLEALNDGINMWSAQGNMTYEDTVENLSIPSGTQSITIGATGTLVTGRPLDVYEATLKDGNNEYDLNVVEDLNASDKTVTGRPSRLQYRKTWPNGTFYFDTTTDQAYTLDLTSLKALTTFADGTTDVALPPHYETALKANLVLWLADEMGAGNRVTPSMVEQARESKKTIIGQAFDVTPSKTEIASRGQYNIETDH